MTRFDTTWGSVKFAEKLKRILTLIPLHAQNTWVAALSLIMTGKWSRLSVSNNSGQFKAHFLNSNAPNFNSWIVSSRISFNSSIDWHVRVISHWLRTRETSEPLRRSIWCCPNNPPKSSSIVFFEKLGACSKTWFDQRISDSKTSSHRLKDQYSTICEIAAKRMLRGRLNLSRPKENVRIL